MMFKTSLRHIAVTAALAAASMAAHADIAINTTLSFDTVASGTTANAYAAGQGLNAITFGNADRMDDAPVYDTVGNLLNDGAFHWFDNSATYGDVLVAASSYAVSASNLLWNDHAPILIQFAGPVDIASFSIQQDTSGFGNLQDHGDRMAFLDSTGHEIDGASIFYTQGAQPGLLLSSGGVSKVSSILLSGGVHYDNLHITTMAAVPEPATAVLALISLGLLGVTARSRKA